jgi:hypothetical protein
MFHSSAQAARLGTVGPPQSPTPSRRRLARHLGLAFGVALAALAIAPTASLAAGGTYTAAITPTAVQTGSTTTFTVTITNTSSTKVGFNHAVVKVPAGFAIVSFGPTLPDSWTASRSNQEINLKGGLVIAPGASLTVPITVTAPNTPGGFTWTTNVTGAGGAFTISGSQPFVVVATAASFQLCPANQPCVSPTLTAPATGNTLATDAQVTAQSGPLSDALSVVVPDPTAAPMLCQQNNGFFGQIAMWHVTTRTSTVTYSVHPPTDSYVYDLGDACFGSTTQFAGSTFNAANQEFEGTLLFCTDNTRINPPPCVVSITQVNGAAGPPFTATIVVNAPQGDPKISG